MTTVLISGASIAGTALAHWLRQHGITPVVVERAPGIRPGGQAVDVRGAALTVLRRMGLEDQARALRTTTRGMSMLDGNGEEVHRSEEFVLSSGRLDSEDIEVLREDLVRIIHQLTAGVEYRFGDWITAIEQDASGATVSFAHGPSRRFDLVVGADGLHSGTRRIAFGPENRFVRHLGSYVSIFSCDNYLSLDDWQIWMNDGAVGAAVTTARDNSELRVFLGFESDPFDYDHRDIAAQKRLVADKVSGMAWEIPNLVERMWRSEDFFFDSMAQVRMDSWAAGRVTLLGDAVGCPSPLSGQGSSLALVGAYILAAEIARGGADHAIALERYEHRMRPFTEANQALATTARQQRMRDVAPEDVEAAVGDVKNAIDLDEVPVP